MAPEEMTPLFSVAGEIKKARHLERAIEITSKPAARRRATAELSPYFRTFAENAFAEIRKARIIVEALSTSGKAFPASAVELADLLASGTPEIVSHLTSSEADAWKADARVIVEAVRLAEPKPIYHLTTDKSEQQQRRIFSDLVAAGFIAGEDSDGASMLQPFLNAFDKSARQQGRIIWAGESTRAKRVSPKQALDFVALMASGIHDITPDFGRRNFPAIFNGLRCSDDTRNDFVSSWNNGGGSEKHGELQEIILPE